MSSFLQLQANLDVTLDELFQVAQNESSVGFSEAVRDRLLASHQFLEQQVQHRYLIYGVTTGYGPLATEYIEPEQVESLQKNLIYHLATGVGAPFNTEQTRAILFARMVSLSKGFSAIRPQSFQLMADFLNHNILPVIPSMGTVGASGDLTPLAHMALALMGESDVVWQGNVLPAAHVLEACGLKKLNLHHKEGLALVNGTSVMTAIAGLNAIRVEALLKFALRCSVLFAELLGGKQEAYDSKLGQVRPHPGQKAVLCLLEQYSQDSKRLQPASKPKLPDTQTEQGVFHNQTLFQDPYTLRCVPQIYGAVQDVLQFHHQTVFTELNSVTDNPLFFPEEQEVIQGGNFYGQHVAFASDALSNAVVKIAIHSERKVARLTDKNLNRGLPAFLAPHDLGIHSGFMGAQVTASALLAEMRSLCVPASIQSIPTNGNNQDVVSMGTIAARKTYRLVELLVQILAIESLCLTQAYELQDGFAPSSDFAESSQTLARAIRAESPFLKEDRPLSSDIAKQSQKIWDLDFSTSSTDD